MHTPQDACGDTRMRQFQRVFLNTNGVKGTKSEDANENMGEELNITYL